MKNTFSLVSTYINPEPTNSQNEESKLFLHGLCSPPTGKTALLRAVQSQLLSLRNVTKGEIFIGWAPLHGDRKYLRGGRSSLR